MRTRDARVLLVDGHVLFRAGLRQVLAAHPRVAAIMEADSICEAVREHGGTTVDLIVGDTRQPGLHGLDGATTLLRHFRTAHLLVLADDMAPDAALPALPGQSGFLSRTASAAQAAAAISGALGEAHGQPDRLPASAAPSRHGMLTPRQLEVLRQLCHGQSNKAIAYRLGLAENTVRVHVAAILDRLDVYSRTEAALKALRLGLVAGLP